MLSVSNLHIGGGFVATWKRVKELLRRRGELLERSFAHASECALEIGSKFGSNHAYSCLKLPSPTVGKSLKPLISGCGQLNSRLKVRFLPRSPNPNIHAGW